MNYSYSRLTNFDNCALQYKFNYIDKLEKDFDNSIESFMGSKVHDTLEELYKKQKLGEILALEKILEFYETEWKKDFNEEIKIVKKNSSQENYFELGKRYLTDYYKHYYPFDQNYTIGLEMEINLKLNDNYSIIGYIDRLAVKDGIYYIHDYKTSGSLPTNEEITKNKQLALYAIAIKEKFNDVRDVKLVWHFLAFDTEIILTKTEEDYDKLKKEVLEKILYIESLSIEDFKPKESILCEWCAYASYCPVKKHLFKTKQLGVEEFQKDYGVNLVNKYCELECQKEKLNLELESVKEKIFEYAEKENLQNIAGSLNNIRVMEFDSLNIPTKNTLKYEELKNILKNNSLDQLFNIDAYWLGKYVLGNLIEKELIDKIYPFVEKKKTKKIYLVKQREL